MARLRRAAACTAMGGALLLAARTGGAVELDLAAPAQRSWRLSGAVYAVAQSADGFLWFGTQAGLRRFDGARFEEIDVALAPALADNHCRALLAARDGSLWIATGSGFFATPHPTLQLKGGTPGLVRYAEGRYTRMTRRDGLAHDWVRALAEHGEGVWIGTEGGLSHFQGGAFRTYGVADGLPHDMVTALHAGARGDLWIGTARGLAVRRGGRIEPTPIGQAVLSLVEDRAGALWVGTSEGLVRLAGGETRTLRLHRPPIALLADAAGRIWAGTDAGLLRIEERPDGLVAVPGGLDGRVLALREDHEGSVWVGTRTGGIVQLHAPRLRNIGPPEGLLGEMAFAVMAARDGSVWMTTVEGIARWSEGRITNFRRQIDIPPGDWRVLAEGPDGAVWIGSLRSGLLRWADGRFVHFGRGEGLVGGVRSLIFDGAGDLWVMWREGGVTRYERGVVQAAATTLTERDGLCRGSAGPAARRAAGGLWIGGEDGLSLLENGRARCYTVADGLPASAISALHEDSDGTLWIGTYGDTGLVRFRDGRFATVPVTAGLPAGTPFSLTGDGRGRLWASSAVGVFRIDGADLEAYIEGRRRRIEPLVFDAQDGMRSQESTASFSPGMAWDRAGRLWVPTLHGVTIFFDPEGQPRPRADTRVEQILVAGRVVDPAARVTLPPGGGDLEIRFTASSFLAPERLRFRHRLDGVDEAWSPADGRRTVRYSRLGPGRYGFRVQALDHLGRPTGREAHLAVRVPPRFYQTWPFFAGCTALGGALAFALHRGRVRRIEARHQAVHAERARIARDLHDNLAQAFASVGLHLDGLRFLLKDAPGDVRAMLDQARGVVNVCQAETRRAIWDIRQPRLEPSPLRAVLEAAVAAVPRPRQTELRLDVAGPPVVLSAMVEHELGHIVREAVVNAVRHASAATISVEARAGEDGLRVLVRDDGRGMPDGAWSARGGIGLVGMRERASRLGGTLEVSSAPGEGTEVSLLVPGDALGRSPS